MVPVKPLLQSAPLALIEQLPSSLSGYSLASLVVLADGNELALQNRPFISVLREPAEKGPFRRLVTFGVWPLQPRMGVNPKRQCLLTPTPGDPTLTCSLTEGSAHVYPCLWGTSVSSQPPDKLHYSLEFFCPSTWKPTSLQPS